MDELRRNVVPHRPTQEQLLVDSMESTGQYWRAVWNVLEGEIPRLVLVNPQHVKALAGRKTDRIDSQRLARYLENNDLAGSFVPPARYGSCAI
jgi:transposase